MENSPFGGNELSICFSCLLPNKNDLSILNPIFILFAPADVMWKKSSHKNKSFLILLRKEKKRKKEKKYSLMPCYTFICSDENGK